MTAAFSLLPGAVPQLSVDSKLYVQYNYHNEFRIHLEEFDYAVCSQNKDCIVRHLTPLTVDEFIPHFSTITTLPSRSIDFMSNNIQTHKQGIDQPDTPISVTGGCIIFDSEENERPPWTITCCCVERKCERLLLVLLLHYGVVLLVVTTSIVILIFRHNENKSSIGVIAILAAFLGYITPSPRQ